MDIPVLVTLHLPLGRYPSTIWNRAPANLHFQFVSESQWLSCPAALLDTTVIPNGVTSPKQRKETMTLVGGHVFPWREHERYFSGISSPAA
jgi:hypothetical protein